MERAGATADATGPLSIPARSIDAYAGDAPPRVAAQRGRFIEVRQRLRTTSAVHRTDVALTLDACSGSVDMHLIEGLKALEVPVTVFVTRKWLLRNPEATRVMAERPELFEFQNHGAMHVPPLIGSSIYGMRGLSDEQALRDEINGGATAIAGVLKRRAAWYRGAGAHYDERSLAIIEELGFRVAGFSLNGDDGASMSAQAVRNRLSRMKPGEIVLAHMNHPGSGTGAGLLRVLPELKRAGFRFVRLSDAEGVDRR